MCAKLMLLKHQVRDVSCCIMAGTPGKCTHTLPVCPGCCSPTTGLTTCLPGLVLLPEKCPPFTETLKHHWEVFGVCSGRRASMTPTTTPQLQQQPSEVVPEQHCEPRSTPYNKHILMLPNLLATYGWVVIMGRNKSNKNPSAIFSIYLVL